MPNWDGLGMRAAGSHDVVFTDYFVKDEEFSDISDNSDIFHVSVDAAKTWCTPEDVDQKLVLQVKEHLRKFPLLPPDPLDPTRSYTNVESCAKLPTLHCAFVGCSFAKDWHPKYHWSLERALYSHLLGSHRKQEMKDVFDKCSEPKDDLEMTALAYYTAAVCEREREHIPIIGPSIDRRTLTLVCRLAGSDNIQSLMCFCCAQIYTHVTSWERMSSQNKVSHSEIKMYAVSESLARLAHNDWSAFCLNFSRDLF